MVAEELTRKFFKNDPRVIATKMESLGFTPIDDELNTRCTLVKAKVAGKTQYFLYVWNDQKCVVCQFAVADDMPIMNLQGEMREISTVIINEYNGN